LVETSTKYNQWHAVSWQEISLRRRGKKRAGGGSSIAHRVGDDPGRHKMFSHHHLPCKIPTYLLIVQHHQQPGKAATTLYQSELEPFENLPRNL
jgi:hypothetical protein